MNGITMRMLTRRNDEREEPMERRYEPEGRRRMREEAWQEPERQHWPEPETRRTMAYSYPMRSTEPMRRPAEPDHAMPRAGLYDGSGMGFGAVAHYEDEQRRESRPAIRATGTVWMNQPEDEGMEFDRETAERWVKGMEGTDPNHPRGGKWTAEALKPLAQKNGFPTDGPEFWEFYAMANAMYSDYAATAKRYGISSPEFYAELARDFIHDADAEPDKVERYYKYIARK